MATNICLVRGGFERFATPPGTSDHHQQHQQQQQQHLDFWGAAASHSDDDKYHCLDLDNTSNATTTTSATTTTKSDSETPEKKVARSMVAICAGCRLEIIDRYILKVNPNLEYHANCLKCSECSTPLDESLTAFVKNGQTFCRNDYMRLFTTRCTRCAGVFDKSELVMRAGVHHTFHLDCFCCVACDKRLETGEEFQIKNNRLYCRADCEIGNLPDTSATAHHHPHLHQTFILNNNNNNSSNSFDDDSWETSTLTSLDHTTPPLSPKSDNGTTNTQRTPIYIGAGASAMHSSSGGSSNGGSSKKKKDKQTTRVRTVLNENQLKILKECYQNNSRPDAVLKEELSRRTGLNARVIRVWFQNKRCKDKKRSNLAQENRLHSEREEVLNRVRLGGIGPMMVTAPTAHIDSQLGGPLDITHYSQWTPTMHSHHHPHHPHQQQQHHHEPTMMFATGSTDMIYETSATGTTSISGGGDAVGSGGVGGVIASAPIPSGGSVGAIGGEPVPAGGSVFPHHFSPLESIAAAAATTTSSSSSLCAE